MSQSPAELAFELIKAAADPKSADRIKQLVEARKAYEAKVAEAKQHHDAAERKLDAAHDKLEAAKAKEADTEARRRDFAAREAEITEKRRELDERERIVAEKEKAAGEMHDKLVGVMRDVEKEQNDTAAALDRRAKQLAAGEADYKERIARIRALAG